MERWIEEERQKRTRERGKVREERQKDFTVCLTGRPEGHAHTVSAVCLCADCLALWRCLINSNCRPNLQSTYSNKCC